MKVQRITDDLRDRIVAGEFPPGGILPTRRILLEHYDVSVAAFQKTINTLIAEGFLESKNSTGVFVRSDPPHLYRLGLALPIYSPAEIQADSLWSALILSVDKFQFEGQPVTLVPALLVLATLLRMLFNTASVWARVPYTPKPTP